MDSLGKYLEKHRKAQGITLEQIERVTKISLSYLRALEREQYHLLPAPIFTIGFLKQYAQCVGLDPEDIVLRYRLGAQEKGALRDDRAHDRGRGGRRRLFWLMTGLLLLLVLLWVLLYPGAGEKGVVVREIRIPRSSLKSIKKERLREELEIRPSGSLAGASTERLPAPPSPAAAKPGEGIEEPALSRPIEVIVQALHPTPIQVRIDGSSPYDTFLETGERHTCRARERVQLRIGDGKGVRIFYNGKAYENLGEHGDVIHITFPPSESG